MNQQNGNPGPIAWPGDVPADLPLIVGLVIEAVPGKMAHLSVELAAIEDFEIVGSDGDHRLAGVWCAQSGKVLEETLERMLEERDDIIGIYPTFVGIDQDEESEALECKAKESAEARVECCCDSSRKENLDAR